MACFCPVLTHATQSELRQEAQEVKTGCKWAQGMVVEYSKKVQQLEGEVSEIRGELLSAADEGDPGAKEEKERVLARAQEELKGAKHDHSEYLLILRLKQQRLDRLEQQQQQASGSQQQQPQQQQQQQQQASSSQQQQQQQASSSSSSSRSSSEHHHVPGEQPQPQSQNVWGPLAWISSFFSVGRNQKLKHH